MAQHRQGELTESQLIALTMLSEQRGANLIQLADLIGDMSAEGLEFLRRLGDPRFEKLTHFLNSAKPETFELLAEMRPEEVQTFKDGIRLVVSVQLLGRVGKWFVFTFLGTVVALVAAWNTVAPWLKGR